MGVSNWFRYTLKLTSTERLLKVDIRHASRVQHSGDSAASVQASSCLLATDLRRYQDLIKISFLGESDYHLVHVEIDNTACMFVPWSVIQITALIGWIICADGGCSHRGKPTRNRSMVLHTMLKVTLYATIVVHSGSDQRLCLRRNLSLLTIAVQILQRLPKSRENRAVIFVVMTLMW